MFGKFGAVKATDSGTTLIERNELVEEVPMPLED